MIIEGYKLFETIGQGGMATVYHGLQLSLNRPVAIKVLNQQIQKIPVAQSSFRQESIIIAKLNHPNIIHVIDRGISDEGSPYFVMEYVDGVELGKLNKQLGNKDINKKIQLCIQLCKAIDYAHKNGVIHRDIKPANIIIDENQQATMLDFGIAQFYQEAQDEPNDEDLVMGTLKYMAPEISKHHQAANTKTDIYSLGILMYEMFTGQSPLNGIRPPSDINSAIPKALGHLILECMAPDPELRPASAERIHDALLHLIQGSHLNPEQVQRAKESVGKKSFLLLDVIKEDQFGALYLFEEISTHLNLVVKKRIGSEFGLVEAKRLSTLEHPNIIKIHGVSKSENAFIVVMEYLEGGSLKDRLIRPLSLEQFSIIAEQLVSALTFAHRNRIIHGNLRPSNILFGSSDETGVKLSDFGFSEHYLSQDRDEDSFNWYIPKSKRGSDGNRSIGKTISDDTYALGVIFYQLLCVELPFRRNLNLKFNKQFHDLPIEIKELIENMLNERFNSLEPIQHILSQYFADESTLILEDESKKVKRTTSSRKKNSTLSSLETLFLFLILTGCIYLVVESGLLDQPWAQEHLQRGFYWLEQVYEKISAPFESGVENLREKGIWKSLGNREN